MSEDRELTEKKKARAAKIKEIYEDCPRLYKQRHLTIHESCMAWGLSVGDGWLDIIHKLSTLIEWNNSNNVAHYPIIEACQVKEKFGGLRFYTLKRMRTYEELREDKADAYPDPEEMVIFSEADKEAVPVRNAEEWEAFLEKNKSYIFGRGSYADGAISMAECFCWATCERCGSTEDVQSTDGWIKRLCGKCRSEENGQ
jgi:hypothetical protein